MGSATATALASLVGAVFAALVHGGARWLEAYFARTPRLDGTSGCIVVLGAAVWRGGRPSGVLAQRLDRAAELYARGVAPTVVCTGGVGRFPPSEAEVGRDYLVERGVSAEAIVLEDRSATTAEQARLVADLCRSLGIETAVVVTSAFHARRALLLFRRAGLEVTNGAVDHPGLRKRVRLCLKEAAALVLLEWSIWAPLGALAGAALALFLSS